MRLRSLLAATAASALTIGLVGAVSTPAHSVTAPSPAKAGSVVAWGNAATAGPAIAVPEDLGLVDSVTVNPTATAVTTVDGEFRIWGADGSVVNEAPAGVTDATAVTLGIANGALLHTDGHISAWGTPDTFADVPAELRAKAIAIQNGTGYAVRTDGTVATWGAPPTYPTPDGLTDLVDVSASGTHILALHADGTVSIWGNTFLPGLLDVPDLGGKEVVQIDTAVGYSTVVLDDGTIKTWGFEGLIPAGEPDFDGQTPAETIVSLSLGKDTANAAAVTADGAVHAWGPTTEVTTVPGSLTGQPVSAIAVSNNHAAAIITTFRDLTKPTISGKAIIGQTLTVTPATFSLAPDAPATGQWYADSTPIEGQSDTTLTLDDTLLGKKISYRTTATRGDDTIESASEEVGPVSPVTVSSTVRVTIAPAVSQYGAIRKATATVRSAGATPTGKVTFTMGKTRATKSLSNGKAVWLLPRTLPVGTPQIRTTYSGDAGTDPSISSAAKLTIRKATSILKAGKPALKGKTKKRVKKATFKLNVHTTTRVPGTGKATLTLKGKTRKKITVRLNSHGNATAVIKKLKRGKYTATWHYTGTSATTPGTRRIKFKA